MDSLSDLMGVTAVVTMMLVGGSITRAAFREHMEDLRSGRIAARSAFPGTTDRGDPPRQA